MNRLTYQRPTRRPPMPPPDERNDAARTMLAAQLIALRISKGISLAAMMEEFGYMCPPRRKLWLKPWVMRRYRCEAERRGQILEAKLAEAPFSTLQRYARIVGVRLKVALTRKVRPSVVKKARAIRSQQKTLRRKYTRPPYRRLAL